MKYFSLFVLWWILELKVVLAEDGKDHDLGCQLSEGLPQANSVPSFKRDVAHRIPLLATGSEEVLAWRIKSLRDELFRLLPLLFVIVESHYIDINLIISLDWISPKLEIFTRELGGRVWKWRHVPQTLIDAVLQVVELSHLLNSEDLLELFKTPFFS